MTPLLLLSTFGLGLRHGVDWDHVAAITDITGTEHQRRRAAWLACLYAIGHGVAVLVLGSLAIVAGDRLPDGIDPIMERVVGATLLLLAGFLVLGLRRGEPVSRGVLILRGLKATRDRLRRTQRFEIEHHHPEPQAHAVATKHVHAVDVTRYTFGGAVTVGLLHGVGAETGTQAVVLVSATRVTSSADGVAILAAFVLGIVVTTAVMAVATAYGWNLMSRTSRAYRVISLTTAVLTGTLGLLYVTGNGDALPPILG